MGEIIYFGLTFGLPDEITIVCNKPSESPMTIEGMYNTGATDSDSDGWGK